MYKNIKHLDKGQKLSDTVKEKGVVKQTYFFAPVERGYEKIRAVLLFLIFHNIYDRCFIVAYWMRGKDWVSYFLKSLRYLCFTEKR